MANAKLPQAYRDGRKDFYGRDFLVSSDVLIPRPETEQLIDLIMSLAGRAYLPGIRPEKRQLSEQFMVIDVGTGSGCIATTLKLELPEAEVLAVDVSNSALKIARENARKFGAKVGFLRSDLLSNVPEEIFQGFKDLVIVANLPYVDKDWGWLDKEALGYEPEIALYAEEGGLALYKKLFSQIMEKKLKTFIVVEADPCQHDELIRYAKSLGFKLIRQAGFGIVLKNS